MDGRDPSSAQRVPTKTTTEARQGVTGHKVRYVLGVSLAAVVILFAILWIAFFGR